jgi:exonuclease SbcD
MRLLHTADLHLGKILHEQSLLDDQAHLLDLLAAELETGGYDLFLVAGDVFDRSVPPPEAVALWDDFLVRVTSSCPRLETVVVSGNHDGAQRLAFASRFLDAHRVHVRTRAEGLDKPVTLTLDGREYDVFAVPFLQAGTLETQRDGEPAVLRSQRELWQHACGRLAGARRPGVPSVLVTHLFTQGGAESDSERLFVGEAEQIPASWLTGWDYVALGHLHQTQEPAPGVRYSGSPLAYSFSEAGQPKGAVKWEDGVAAFLPLIPAKPLTRLSGTFDDFARGKGYEAYREHWLELTLTDPALVPGPLERLRPRFPGLLSLVQAPARSTGGLDTAVRRRTGDVAADALRFLTDLGQEAAPDVQELLAELAREATVEAS